MAKSTRSPRQPSGSASRAAGPKLREVMVRQTARRPALDLDSVIGNPAARPAASDPVEELARRIDYGSAENIPSQPRTLNRGSAITASRTRATMPDPNFNPRGGARERAIPAQELETRPPIDEFAMRDYRRGTAQGFNQPQTAARGIGQGLARQMEEEPDNNMGQGDEWDAKIARMQAQAQVQPVQQTQPASVAGVRILAHHVTPADADRMWDWVRQDQDRGAVFFGTPMLSGLHVHEQMAAYVKADRKGAAIIRAMYVNDQPIGLAILHPIDPEQRVAVAHLYLRPDLRGNLPQLLPLLLDEAEAHLPDGIRIAVYENRPALAALLSSHGFVPHTLLIRDRG